MIGYIFCMVWILIFYVGVQCSIICYFILLTMPYHVTNLILHCVFVWFVFAYPLLPVSLDMSVLDGPYVARFSRFVSFWLPLCWQFLWIVSFGLPLCFQFLCIVNFGLPLFFQCPWIVRFGLPLCFQYPWIVSFGLPLCFQCPWIVCFGLPLCFQCPWIVSCWLPLLYSLTFNYISQSLMYSHIEIKCHGLSQILIVFLYHQFWVA